MHPMEPVELAGDLVAIEPLRVEHAAGLFGRRRYRRGFRLASVSPTAGISIRHEPGSRMRLPIGERSTVSVRRP